jgi:hypothetical protein
MYIKRTAKRVQCIAGTSGLDMGTSSNLSRYLPIRNQETANAILEWIRIYEPKANWQLEEVKGEDLP